jgi:hypothetical protein
MKEAKRESQAKMMAQWPALTVAEDIGETVINANLASNN